MTYDGHMAIFPHLAWFLDDNQYPVLWRRDTGRQRWHSRVYETCAEACEAAGITLEDFIRQR